MVKNLLALLLALQKVDLDDDTQLLLDHLGGQLATLSRDAIQTKIDGVLGKNPLLAEQYQPILAQLQSWTDEELRLLLPNPEQLNSFKSKKIATLGPPPSPLRTSKEELVNEFVYVAIVVLQHDKPAETSKTLLSTLLSKLRSDPLSKLDKDSHKLPQNPK